MKATRTVTRTGGARGTCGRALACTMLAFIKKYSLAGGRVQAAAWAWRPVRVAPDGEVLRR